MKRYYIDVENIGNKWTKLIKETNKEDFILLITSSSKTIFFSNLIYLFNTDDHAKINIKEAYPGQKGDQSADHALLAEINTDTYLYENAEFVIVSNDKGYDNFINEKFVNGYNVKRISFQAETVKDVSVDKTDLNIEKENKKKIFEEIYPLVAKKIEDCVKKTKPTLKIVPFDYTLAAKKYVEFNCDFEKTRIAVEPKVGKGQSPFAGSITKKQRVELEIYTKNLIETKGFN